jgi:uncharacterized repeat protein (TIGR02543 family)
MEAKMKNNQKTWIFSIFVILMLLLGALGLPAKIAQAADVMLDGTPSSGTANPNSSSISFSATIGSGTDRLMLVGVSWNCGTTNRTISSATFTPDGDSPLDLDEVITQLYSFPWQGGPSTAYRYTAIYSLLGPPSGVSGTVNITFSGGVANGIVAGEASFAGVDQTTPLGTPGSATGTSDDAAPNPSVTLSGLTGSELVFDSVFIGTNSTSQTLIADAGQSELWNVNGWTSSNSSFNTRGAASTKQATGDTATMSWTTGGYTSIATRWVIAAVPIHPVPIYTLTASNDGHGSVTLDPAGGSYAAGTTVTLTPVPSAGYHFASWSGDDAGDIIDTGGVYTIVMDDDKSVTANFAIDTYTLTASNDGHGSVTLTPPGGTYDYGTTVTLTPVPSAGYHFASWSGDDAGDIIDTGGVYTIVMDGNKSVTANFAINIHYIFLPIVVH